MRVDSACNSQRTRDSGVLDNMARHGIQNDRSRGERRRTHGRQLDAALGRGATIPPTTTTTFQGGASVPRGGAKCPPACEYQRSSHEWRRPLGWRTGCTGLPQEVVHERAVDGAPGLNADRGVGRVATEKRIQEQEEHQAELTFADR